MDPFVLLTPILLLGVLVLVRFVACLSEPVPLGLQLQSAVQADQAIVLTYAANSNYDSFDIKRGTASGGPYALVGTAPSTSTSFTDTNALAGGTEYFYVYAGVMSGQETHQSNELAVTFESLITVTIDNPTPTPGPGPFSGAYKNLNFPPGQWIWVDTFTGGGPANAVTFPAADSPGGDIMFVNGPRVLQSIRVFPKQQANVTIADNTLANSPVTVAAPANASLVIPTNWSVPTTSFHISTDIGFDLLIDTIVYVGPA